MANEELADRWRGLLAGFPPGSPGVAAWCAANGVTAKQYQYWRRRLRELGEGGQAREWLAVRADVGRPQHKPGCAGQGGGLAVRVGAASIDVSRGFDEALLAAVVRALARA